MKQGMYGISSVAYDWMESNILYVLMDIRLTYFIYQGVFFNDQSYVTIV